MDRREVWLREMPEDIRQKKIEQLIQQREAPYRSPEQKQLIQQRINQLTLLGQQARLRQLPDASLHITKIY